MARKVTNFPRRLNDVEHKTGMARRKIYITEEGKKRRVLFSTEVIAWKS